MFLSAGTLVLAFSPQISSEVTEMFLLTFCYYFPTVLAEIKLFLTGLQYRHLLCM